MLTRRDIPHPVALVVFDFDGVMTDNTVYIDQDGREMVRCHRGDGLGIAMLKRAGVSMCILSTETNPVVAARGNKLGIPVFQSCGDKKAFLERYFQERGIDAARVIYVGNDVNDIEAMRLVGFTAAPADAHPRVRQTADMVLSLPGGRGAVRELCDLLLRAAQGKEEQV
jgi:N-acylneuraminate cytidylyltransferase